MSQDIEQLIEKAQRELRGMTGDVAFLSDLITALESLQRKLAEQSKEIERLAENCRDFACQAETDAEIIKSSGKEIHFLRDKLAEQAAVIEGKDEALRYAADAFRELAAECDGDYETAEQMEAAIALTASPEILRKRDADTVRNVAGIVGGDAEKELNRIAQRIEKGGE